MSSILRALRRLEADARPREDDGATLHEHVVLPGTRRRSPARTGMALAALVVAAVCVGGLLLAAASWLRPRGEASPAPSVAARLALPPSRLVAPARPPREIAPFAPGASTGRVPVAEVQDPPPAKLPRAAAAPVPSAGDRPKLQIEARGTSGSRKGAPVGVDRILWHPTAEKRRAWLRVDGEETAREVREGERVGRYAVTRIDAGSVLFRSGNIELRHKLGADGP